MKKWNVLRTAAFNQLFCCSRKTSRLPQPITNLICFNQRPFAGHHKYVMTTLVKPFILELASGKPLRFL